MDINQASQMLTWLDEEHRRDKALITELRQKLESQSIEIADQSRRLQELEVRLASTQGKLSRFNTLEEAIRNVRDELVLMVHAQEEDVERYQREQGQARQVEQESSARALNELRRSLEAIPPLHEKIDMLRAEDKRLSELTLSLQTRVTAHERQTAQLPERISYVEGQRAQDLKSVSTLQEEVVGLLRRIETIAGKQELVEDLARKNEQRIRSVLLLREEVVKKQAQLAEDVRIKAAETERQVRDAHAEIARFAEMVQKQRLVIERYTRQQEEWQKYLSTLDDFKEGVSREQKQLAELQRMAETRQRQELEEWKEGTEQRWNKFRLEWDSHWHQQEAQNEEMAETLKRTEGWRESDVEQVRQLQKALLTTQKELRAKVVELWRIHERAAILELDDVRRRYDKINSIVTEKTADA